MFLTDNNIIYRKNFTFYNVNKNWNSFKKTSQRHTLQLLNILVKKQINFILGTCGKKKNKLILWTKKKRRLVSFNKILKQKLKNKKIYFLLKCKKNLFMKLNKKKNILFLNFIENFFFWNRRVINILWKLKKRRAVNKNLKLINKIIKHKRKIMSRKKKRKDKNKYKLMFYVDKLKKKKKFFKKKTALFKSKKKIKFIKIKKLFVCFCQKEKIKLVKKIILNIEFLNKEKKLMKILKVKLDSLKKKKKFWKSKKKKKIRIKKTKKKIIRFAKKIKKYKFFKNKIKALRKKIRNKWKKRRRLFKMKFKLKKKNFEKKLKEFKWKFINVRNKSRKRTVLNFLMGWNSFYNNYFVNTRKVLKKRRLSLASFSMHNINKKIVVLITIFKNRRKLQRKPRQKSNDWHYNVIRTLTKQKALKKFYKKINNVLLNIKIKQNWNRMNKTPVFFKTVNYFSGSTTKGWKKIVKIMKKSYYLQRFSKNIYFENTLFNTLMSCYFKNPENLTKNLGENLRKQWKHRQQLFFLYYLIMSVLWKFGLKKISSYRKIKSIYMMIRGKINSGTRTKYFQIKASYKPSFLSYQNHMSFAKGISKAKTGIFGIKSWIHY